MVRKYIILAVTAALLSPCLLSFADDDLQDQLDDWKMMLPVTS